MAQEPATKRAMAFFDGQNLYRHAKDAFGHTHPNYDPKKLHEAVCQQHGWIPNLVRFYTGIPDVKDDAMWASYWTKRKLTMDREGIHITTRPLRYHGQDVYDENGVKKQILVGHEKGIDVRLALDIVSTARTKQWDVAVIFSQDQDLCEVAIEVKAIARQQDRWIKICCPFPSGPKASSRRGINGTDWFQMDETFYNSCIDVRDYR